ncbi:MAG: hypothetical protein ACMG51_02120 [Ginsengibacter sp.]
MKAKYYLASLIFLGFYSCTSFKAFDDRAKAARKSTHEDLIIKENGVIITGLNLRHKNHDPNDRNLVRVTNSDDALSMNGIKYNDRDVIAFQDRKAFHKRFNNIYLIRLVKGKINLYYFDQTGYVNTYIIHPSEPSTITSTFERKSYFFFEKEDNEIYIIGISNLKNALKDDQQALDKLNSYYPKNFYSKELNIEKLVSVIEIYNQ